MSIADEEEPGFYPTETEEEDKLSRASYIIPFVRSKPQSVT